MKLPSILSLIARSPVSVLSYRCTTGFTMLCCDMLAYNNPEQTKRLSPGDTSVGGAYISYGCGLSLPLTGCRERNPLIANRPSRQRAFAKRTLFQWMAT